MAAIHSTVEWNRAAYRHLGVTRFEHHRDPGRVRRGGCERGLILGFGLWRGLMLDRLPVLGKPAPHALDQRNRIRSAFRRRHLTEPALTASAGLSRRSVTITSHQPDQDPSIVAPEAPRHSTVESEAPIRCLVRRGPTMFRGCCGREAAMRRFAVARDHGIRWLGLPLSRPSTFGLRPGNVGSSCPVAVIEGAPGGGAAARTQTLCGPSPSIIRRAG